ncbi:MAG: hypothetical protein WC479_11605 [Candidatus Izemoplasmatales bacterium]|jgi:hypothetical protein
MIEDEKLGLKIAENSDEKFWTETKEKCEEGIKSAKRNILLDEKLIELCNEQLKKPTSYIS